MSPTPCRRSQTLCFEAHDVTIVALDAVPIEPVRASAINPARPGCIDINAGQRCEGVGELLGGRGLVEGGVGVHAATASARGKGPGRKPPQLRGLTRHTCPAPFFPSPCHLPC